MLLLLMVVLLMMWLLIADTKHVLLRSLWCHSEEGKKLICVASHISL